MREMNMKKSTYYKLRAEIKKVWYRKLQLNGKLFGDRDSKELSLFYINS
jgi:hypothetical protein